MCELDDLAIETLHQLYFGEEASLGNPSGIMYTKICWTQFRLAPNLPEHVRQDLIADVYRQMFESFDSITAKFHNSGREKTRSNLDSWLTITIKRRLIDALRAIEKSGGTLDIRLWLDKLAEPPRSDPIHSARVRVLVLAVLAELPEPEREVLIDRLGDGKQPAEIADERGIEVTRVYDLLFRAKLRCRNKLIRRIVEASLSNSPKSAALFEPVIQKRCCLDHPCHMYRLACPKADEVEGEEEFGHYVEEQLEHWGLPSVLDRCYWANR